MRHSIGILTALILLIGPVFAQDEELKPRILTELNSEPVVCPEEFPNVEICGTFHGGFSTFKFELEFEIGLEDYQAEPLTSWKLLRGVYARTYRVGEEIVSIGFDRKRHLVLLKRGELPEEELVDEAVGGDDDDDDDDDESDDRNLAN